jgi:hypothetical protein
VKEPTLSPAAFFSGAFVIAVLGTGRSTRAALADEGVRVAVLLVGAVVAESLQAATTRANATALARRVVYMCCSIV